MAEVVRKIFLEVVEARDLLPKDGTGTSSPYVVVDFDGQRRRTQTVCRDLNPIWNEVLEFNFSGSGEIAGDPLEVDVMHDRRVGPSRRSNFLGRVRLDSRHFVRKGEEALIHFPLEKKSFFSWVRGDIGLRIYYDDVPIVPPAPPTRPPEEKKAESQEENKAMSPEENKVEAAPPVVSVEEQHQEAVAKQETEDPPATDTNGEKPSEAETMPPPLQPLPEKKAGNTTEADIQAPREPTPGTPQPPLTPLPVAAEEKEAGPKWVPQPETRHPPMPEPVEKSSYELVEKMQYLFVRVVRARSLPGNAKPHVRVAAYGHRTATRTARRSVFHEWDQTFAFARDATAGDYSNLEISVWDFPPDADDSASRASVDERYFLGGVCFDVAEVDVRGSPESPLAPQWYRLEGGAAAGGDLMLAAWRGTQADEAFADAWKADSAPSSRSKIYLSPKLWYLRATIIEAQETPLPVRDFSLAVRASLGFQVLKTGATIARNSSLAWNEDLLFVAAEPFSEEQNLALWLESRHGKETTILGSATVPLSSVERRVNDRKVTSRWLDLQPSADHKRRLFGGRLHVRLCLDGGYHVQDEPLQAASDYRPSARQLWQPAVGTVELGVIGCRGLLPMKTIDGKGATDAFVIAKYGNKWARTRTVAGSFDPAWNEQFTWPVFDPSTVLTLAVFDDAGHSKESAACRPMGRTRIRISTLKTNRAYRCSYPLLLFLPSGLKRMGEIEIAVRFVRYVSTLDLLHIYSQPMLPVMHQIRPIGAAQREGLRITAARVVASHLARAEPPLRREAVMWMLEATEPTFSMRRIRANWGRIAAATVWIGDGIRWLSQIRDWRNPTATVMAHIVALLLIWFPELIVPAISVHLGLLGLWRYRRRPRLPTAGPAARESGADVAGREELDEEFDAVPSVREEEIVRTRYERARAIGARLQAMVGDAAAQAERVQALVSWRDPRATAVFVACCFVVAVVMYVMPARMMAVAATFYFLRHPVFRRRTPPPAINFFRRLPSLADRII